MDTPRSNVWACARNCRNIGQSWKTTAHASLATPVGGKSAGKSRLKQQIPNVKSITERWRYFVDFLLSKGKGFCLFYWPFIVHSCFTSCIFAARTLDFAIKFRLVFRYEVVVFRRYVLALLSVGLLRKFEAYLVYLSLNWTKNPRRFSFFQKFHHFTYMLLWFSRANWWHAQSFSALSATAFPTA